MNYPFLLARRLSLSSDSKATMPGVKVATAAVALSVVVMVASVAIVLGFKREIREKVIGFNSHITLFAQPDAEGGNNVLTLTPSLHKSVLEHPDVTSASLAISVPAVLKTPDNFKGIYLKSIADSLASSFVRSQLEEGSVPDFSKEGNENKVVISRLCADALGLHAGDKIDSYFITDDVRVRRLTVAGIYNSHFDNYDDVFVFGSLTMLQKLNNLSPDQGTSLQISVNDFDRVEEISDELNAKLVSEIASGYLNRIYVADNARHTGAGYFQWLDLLDMNVTVILTLMMIVGCITLVSGMLIIILDKKRFIGVMKSMGVPTRKLRRVFVYLSLRVALYGILIADVLSLGILWLQKETHFIPLDPESYYIDFVPVELYWWVVPAINAGVLLVAYLVLAVPSRLVAGISPAESMRDES